MDARVAIIIVNWKTPDLLAGCLQSIYADAGSHSFEIWVVDNNSGDHSVQMVRERFPAVRLIANDENVGFPRACNQVLPLVSAPYVLLLNPDTVIVGNAISELANFLETNADCGAVGPKVLNPDGTLQLACRRSFPSPEAAFYRMTYLSKLFPNHPRIARYNLTFSDPDQQTDCDVLSGSCMMVRNSVIKQVGLMDDGAFMFAEDVDWCWRFKKAGWRVVYNPAAQCYHYHGASWKRLKRVRATIDLHVGMVVFYRKHLAADHSLFFNMLVYAGIALRAIAFILIGAVASLFTPRSVAKQVVIQAGQSTPEKTLVDTAAR
jgi:GT2 family glycosyltransferase